MHSSRPPTTLRRKHRRPSRLRLCLLLTLPLLGGPGRPAPAGDAPCMFAQTASLDPSSLRACYAGPRARWPLPQVQPGVAWQELAPLPAHPPEPPDNPGTPAKIALGRSLFEDPRLSRSGQIACASCHDPQLGWGDGRRVSFGHDRQAGRRNAPSVAMAGHARSLFWDGRADTLEAQALHPIQDAREMAFTAAALERRLNRSADYPDRFAQVFGTRRIGVQEVARALAAYQRSLAPRPGRFDRFLQGRPDALDDRQLRGLHLFRTRAGCMNCHSGPTLSDDRFHNLGLHFHGRRYQDLGRYEVTGDPADSGRFRTPSLRGVARTGPWMHNGLFADLHSVVAFYNAGGATPRARAAQPGDPPFPRPDPLLRPLQLDRQDQDAIVAFLETL